MGNVDWIDQGDDGSDRAYFRILTDEKVERVHDATMKILETIGFKVEGEEAISLLVNAGCSVHGDIVKAPRKLVEEAIDSAPGRFTIYNREGEEALHLGTDATYTHTGYTPLTFYDLDTGERRDYTLEDFRVVSRVADALEHTDVIGTPGVVRPSRENPLEVINQLEFEAMLTNSIKPMHILVANGLIMRDCLEMAEAVAAAKGTTLREKPFAIVFANPISPLILNEDTVDKILLAAEWGVPMLCGPLPMGGGTAPVTMAGNMAQAMAETIMGLVLSQVANRGTPYIMTAAATTMDMKTGNLSGGGPERDLLVGASIEMGHYYGVPIKGGFVGGGGHGILDAESGWHQVLSSHNRMLTGGSAGLGVGPGSSLEAAVMADELMGMLKAVVKGVPVNDETLAVDVIRDVGPGGGTYLGHPHTFKNFRGRWEPTITKRMKYEEWVAAGRVPYSDHVKTRLRQIMATHQPKPIPAAAEPVIAAIIQRARDRVPAPASASG